MLVDTFCTECQCLDPQPNSPDYCNPNIQSDGSCDDVNNNDNCEYDGGDCCGENVVTVFCYLCQCLDPTYTTMTPHSPLQTSNSKFTTTLSSECYYSKGDDYCHDENNHANCEYDGGDCCGDNFDASYCTLCQCLDPAYTTTPISATTP